MVDKCKCNDGFIWNPSICECECDRSCDVGEYLHYTNCKCGERLIDELVEGCSEDINGNEMIYNVTLNNYKKSMQFLYNIHSIINFNF